MVTGLGTGFVMCWQNNVRWSINQHEDPRKFMTVNSGHYVLAIPDLTRFAKSSDSEGSVKSSNVSVDSRRQMPTFRKVIMKLSGNVQWLAGLVFERNTDDGTRRFAFKPHYDVILRNPEFARSCNKMVIRLITKLRERYRANVTRGTMLLEDFEAIIFTFLSRLRLLWIEIGP